MNQETYIELEMYLKTLTGETQEAPILSLYKGIEQFSIYGYPFNLKGDAVEYFANMVMNITKYTKYDWRIVNNKFLITFNKPQKEEK